MDEIKGITLVDENGIEEIIPNIFYWRIYSDEMYEAIEDGDDSKLVEGVNYMDLPVKILKSYIVNIFGNLSYFCDVLPLVEVPEWFLESTVIFNDYSNIEEYQGIDINLLYTEKENINPFNI